MVSWLEVYTRNFRHNARPLGNIATTTQIPADTSKRFTTQIWSNTNSVEKIKPSSKDMTVPVPFCRLHQKVSGPLHIHACKQQRQTSSTLSLHCYHTVTTLSPISTKSFTRGCASEKMRMSQTSTNHPGPPSPSKSSFQSGR